MNYFRFRNSFQNSLIHPIKNKHTWYSAMQICNQNITCLLIKRKLDGASFGNLNIMKQITRLIKKWYSRTSFFINQSNTKEQRTAKFQVVRLLYRERSNGLRSCLIKSWICLPLYVDKPTPKWTYNEQTENKQIDISV